MFHPTSQLLCIVLLLFTLTFWGAWPSIRILCKSDAPVFAILYISGQLLAIVTLCLTLGLIQADNAYFDNQTVFGGFTDIGRLYRIVFLVFGGFCLANADFLCACACTRLPFSVAYPLFAGWALIQATILNFLLEGGGAFNVGVLFGGIVLALGAISCMALSDYCAAPKTVPPADDIDESVYIPLEGGIGGLSRSASADTLLNYSTNTSTSDSSLTQTSLFKHSETLAPTTKKLNPWIYACVLAGVLGGAWSPLSSFARTGTGSIKNPYTSVLLYVCGELLALPVMLTYYAKYIVPLEMGGAQHAQRIRDYFSAVVALPGSSKIYGLLAGAIVGAGYTFFFIASEVVPGTIAFAIANCAPMVAIIIGITIFRQLEYATYFEGVFIILALFLFIGAVSLLVLANSI